MAATICSMNAVQIYFQIYINVEKYSQMITQLTMHKISIDHMDFRRKTLRHKLTVMYDASFDWWSALFQPIAQTGPTDRLRLAQQLLPFDLADGLDFVLLLGQIWFN